MMWGGELVLRDGAPAGQVTLGGLGRAAVGACVGLAYVWDEAGAVLDAGWVTGGRYQVNVGGRVCPATVSLTAPFDPTSSRVRS